MQNKGTFKKTEDKGAEMKKLSDDYLSGKISIEEFTKKIQELQKEMTETIPQNSITVNADFQSRIVGTENPTEPVPIESSGSEWFDDANFKK